MKYCGGISGFEQVKQERRNCTARGSPVPDTMVGRMTHQHLVKRSPQSIVTDSGGSFQLDPQPWTTCPDDFPLLFVDVIRSWMQETIRFQNQPHLAIGNSGT